MKAYGDIEWAIKMMGEGEEVQEEGTGIAYSYNGIFIKRRMPGKFFHDDGGWFIKEFREEFGGSERKWILSKKHKRIVDGTWLKHKDGGQYVESIGWLRDAQSYVLRNYDDDYCWMLHYSQMDMFDVVHNVSNMRLNKVTVRGWTIKTDPVYTIEAVNPKGKGPVLVIYDHNSEQYRYIDMSDNEIMVSWSDDDESGEGDYTFKMTTEEVDGKTIARTLLSGDVEHLDSYDGKTDLYLYGVRVSIDMNKKLIEVREDTIDTGVC